MWNSLKPADGIIDLTSDVEMNEQKRCKPVASIVDLIVDVAEDEPKQSDDLKQAAPIKLENKVATNRRLTSKRPVPEMDSMPMDDLVEAHKRGKVVYREKWAPHEGHGNCRGLRGPCIMGRNGAAAPAGPSGYCDLCNLKDIKLLHEHGEGRLTHLLLQLAEPEASVALKRIHHKDAAVAKDLKHRMERARHRKSAHIVRRGPRGPYKKKGAE